MHDATTLYRHFDEDGILLYVGVTDRGGRRAKEHRNEKVWWRFVALTTYKHIPDRSLALLCEETVIAEERPVFNVKNGAAGRDSAVFDYLQCKSLGVPPTETPATVYGITGHGAPRSSMARFIGECLVIGGGRSKKVTCREIWDSYTQWCVRVGEEPTTEASLGRAVTAAGCGAWRDSARRFRTNVALVA